MMRNAQITLGEAIRRPSVGLALIAALAPRAALASTAGTLPWDTALSTLETDITGPFVFLIGMISLAVALVVLVHHGDLTDWSRRLLYVVVAVAGAIGAVNLASALGITGAIV